MRKRIEVSFVKKIQTSYGRGAKSHLIRKSKPRVGEDRSVIFQEIFELRVEEERKNSKLHAKEEKNIKSHLLRISSERKFKFQVRRKF